MHPKNKQVNKIRISNILAPNSRSPILALRNNSSHSQYRGKHTYVSMNNDQAR